MTKSRNFRVALLIAAALASAGCSVFKHSKAKTPILGERIPVLTTESDAEPDPATQALPFNLPAPTENAAWAESGGNASNSMSLGKKPSCAARRSASETFIRFDDAGS